MKLFLTGGTGFFGKTLLRHWTQAAAEGRAVPDVTVLSRNPEAFLTHHPEFVQLPWLRFLEGDVLRPSSFPTAGGFTHVLHAAADSTLGALLTPLQRYSQIADGTRHLLDYAVAHGVRRLLLTSSGAVYGPQPPEIERIPESYNGMADPLDERSAYGVAKRCAEHLCALYGKQYGLEVVIARCFAFVGCDLPLNVHFAVGNFIRDALCSQEIAVGGDGTPIRSYLDQRDLANWLCTIITDGQAGHAYNVGSERAIQILDLAHLVRDLLAPGKVVRVMGMPSAQDIRSRYVPSTARARGELRLWEAHSLEQSILETARNHASQLPKN